MVQQGWLARYRTQTAPGLPKLPAQPIPKSNAAPGLLAMLLTTKYVDGIPLHRFEKVLQRHGVDIPRQTLARWVIQGSELLQSLVNLHMIPQQNHLFSRVISVRALKRHLKP